jgi:hypothetical protein
MLLIVNAGKPPALVEEDRMIELDDNIEALEVCIRNGTPS